MGIFHIIVLLVVCGVVLYCLNAFVPMDARFKQAINLIIGVALFLVVVWWLLGFFGVDLGHSRYQRW